MFRFDLRAFAHDGEIGAAGERPERTEPVSPTSWDFAGSICSLYLKLSSPNRGRQFVFCQPQLDKIQCLPLTKYAHFWMTELVGDDTAFAAEHEVKVVYCPFDT